MTRKTMDDVRDPNVCLSRPCVAKGFDAYCARCVTHWRALLVPGMRNRDIEAHYTVIGRSRALTEAESVVLETAVFRNLANERARSKAA